MHQHLRVLIVEDLQILRKLLSELLNEAGFLVATCDSGETAQVELAECHYDAIIADNTLAGALTGADLLAQASEQYPTLGLVFLSGDPHPAKALPARAVVLSKPCTSNALTEAVSYALKDPSRAHPAEGILD